MTAVGGEGGSHLASVEGAVLDVLVEGGVARDEPWQVTEFVQKGGQQVVAAIGIRVCGRLEVKFRIPNSEFRTLPRGGVVREACALALRTSRCRWHHRQ